MKSRHIVMIVIIVIFILVLFGNRNTHTLTSTVDGEMLGNPATTTLTIKMKENKVSDMKMEVNMPLSSEYQNQKQTMINSINSEGKMTASSTKDGIKLTSDMKSDYFDALELNKNSTSEEMKEVLETQGFICKEK